ncbi:hypothetical protein FSP39_000552 [Pinctada imbricata]|uniref:Uncharacterized protein n=1 Tax=Pinctada imbricata TaxID=66713 RepID=A0AA88XK95_PINIB|nr:hypothetical protein FSP39_000552 [Pinctada imbricata]
MSKYYSWKPDPHAVATNALDQTWTPGPGYAFPPFCLIGRCLVKVREECTQIVLITPTWQTQPWYPILLQMSIDLPVLLPMNGMTLLSPTGDKHPLILNNTLQLAGWKVSGDLSLQEDFRKKLSNFSFTRCVQARNQLTIVPGRSGMAGVSSGKLIPFTTYGLYTRIFSLDA